MFYILSTENFVLQQKKSGYDSAMKRKDENINVRLPPDLKERSEIVAKGCGSSLSIIIRLLLERLVEHAEEHGGKIVMPPDFVKYEITKKQ